MAIDSTRPVIKVLAPGPQGRVGDTGDKGDKGDKGDQGDQGNPSVIRGTLSSGVWVEPATPQAGDLWIAGGSITGDVTAALGEGLSYDGDTWTNVGQVRGPVGAQGIQGYSITIKGTLSAGAWSAPASPTVGDIWIAGGSITGDVTAALGDGIEYTVSGWLNVGQVRGPIGPASSNSGTTGKLAKFTSANTVGDSIISESASVPALTIAGTLTVTGGTVTANTPVINSTQTVNSGGTTFDILKWDITNTASASGSRFISLLLSGVRKFSLLFDGSLLQFGTWTDDSNCRYLKTSNTSTGAAKIDSTGTGTGVTGNTLELAAGGVTGLRLNQAGGAEGPLGTLTRTHAGDAGCILPSSSNGSRVETTLARHTIGTGNYSISLRTEIITANPSATTYIAALTEDANSYAYLLVDTSGRLCLYCRLAGAAINSQILASNFPANYGSHVCLIVIVRSGTTLTAYLNGNSIYTATVADLAVSFTSAATFRVGNASTGAGSWTQRIYNARLFRRALSAADVVNLMNKGVDPADEWDNPVALTSGTLVIGKRYKITTFVSGDSFTNVGAASNASGVEFIATGTTPTTWTNSSTLDRIGCALDWDIGVGTGLAIPDRSSNCYTGTGTGISHPVPKRFGEVVIRRQLLASEISSSVATTKLFDLPANCGIADIEIDRASAMDAGITLNIGKFGTAARYASAMAADATGLLGTDSLFKFSESSTVDTAIYVQKSGATTVGSVTIKVRFIIRG